MSKQVNIYSVNSYDSSNKKQIILDKSLPNIIHYTTDVTSPVTDLLKHLSEHISVCSEQIRLVYLRTQQSQKAIQLQNQDFHQYVSDFVVKHLLRQVEWNQFCEMISINNNNIELSQDKLIEIAKEVILVSKNDNTYLLKDYITLCTKPIDQLALLKENNTIFAKSPTSIEMDSHILTFTQEIKIPCLTNLQTKFINTKRVQNTWISQCRIQILSDININKTWEDFGFGGDWAQDVDVWLCIKHNPNYYPKVEQVYNDQLDGKLENTSDGREHDEDDEMVVDSDMCDVYYGEYDDYEGGEYDYYDPTQFEGEEFDNEELDEDYDHGYEQVDEMITGFSSLDLNNHFNPY